MRRPPARAKLVVIQKEPLLPDPATDPDRSWVIFNFEVRLNDETVRSLLQR